ncbi:hypothetical protein SORDD17_00593 [Streptococcus oralis]|uniref:Uncharacterized protein n=1 Tax=Streptococcus oralis TaxID=1303 RepID=A0A139RN57_STROR|nr:hypothetical protein SORDD17_00593 [Streptococcus oralis]
MESRSQLDSLLSVLNFFFKIYKTVEIIKKEVDSNLCPC